MVIWWNAFLFYSKKYVYDTLIVEIYEVFVKTPVKDNNQSKEL